MDKSWPFGLPLFRCLSLIFLILIPGCATGNQDESSLLPTSSVTPPPTTTFTFTPQNTVTPSPVFPTDPEIGTTWTRPADGMAMVYIPPGKFIMGISVEQGMEFCANNLEKYWGECPPDMFAMQGPFSVYVGSYWIDQTEVTNAMYETCVNSGSCIPPRSTGPSVRSDYYGNIEYANYPMAYVSWNDAYAYCKWAGARLPTEAEWEKAARGTDGRLFPWGDNSPTCSLANWGYDSCVVYTSEVGSYPEGASPYMVYDMAGNVWEWVNSLAYPYPYVANDGRNDLDGKGFRSLKGGAWYSGANVIRSSARHALSPEVATSSTGFRCAISAP